MQSRVSQISAANENVYATGLTTVRFQINAQAWMTDSSKHHALRRHQYPAARILLPDASARFLDNSVPIGTLLNTDLKVDVVHGQNHFDFQLTE